MKSVSPTISYIIWFSQRTGSSLLCKMLESTGIAGIPNEWLNDIDLNTTSPASLQKQLWTLGSTKNGVFGMKLGMSEPHNIRVLNFFKRIPNCPSTSRAQVWEHAFPNCKHIFMTRRNKVRLAVSWWKAIKTDEWHRNRGAARNDKDITDDYRFEAINHLVLEATMREAAIQEFFTEGGISPLNVVYEDFISDMDGTLSKVLSFLGLPHHQRPRLDIPFYEQLADNTSEDWVQRFRKECQSGWRNIGW